MILQRLCDYYDRIVADPHNLMPEVGFASQQISFCVVLTETGTLHAIEDVRTFDEKAKHNVRMSLPYLGTRAGQKITPMFMWDQPKYLLGWIPDDLAKNDREIERARLAFTASQELHLSFKAKVNSEDFSILMRFYESWNPESLSAEQSDRLRETVGGFGVFRVLGRKQYIHNELPVSEAWTEFLMRNTSDTSQCLVTGEISVLADLHPAVKGVSKRSTPLVSFNDDAYTSLGKAKCFNSPVGKIASYKYTNALNYLLEPSRRRKLQIGDTTCVFWADEQSGISEDIFGMGVDIQLHEDEPRAEEIVNIFKHAIRGESVLPEPGTGFHVLGLAPNAARISVRFWISGTAIEIVGRVLEHQKRLQIVGGIEDEGWISLRFILAQTTRDPKDVQPLLGGSLLRSILTGGPYPESLLAAIIRRIRAEQDIRHVKAATIKAILNHNHAKEISVMLDVDRPEGAYQLGRLFACLERAQEDALPGLNATIKDRYFGAASSTPASVFPRLIRMNQHHIGKLEGGKKVVAEKRLQEVVGRIDTFPSHFGLIDQGLFAIGYYHQRQDFFTKKDKPTE